MAELRKEIIKKSFDVFSSNYDKYMTETHHYLTEILLLNAFQYWFRDVRYALDIGTGTGNVAINLTKIIPNVQVTAIDFSNEMLNKAEKRAQEEKPKGIVFRCISIEDFVKKSHSKYDLIVVSFVVCWFDNPKYIFKKLSDMLSPNGFIFIIDDVNQKAPIFKNKNKNLNELSEIRNMLTRKDVSRLLRDLEYNIVRVAIIPTGCTHNSYGLLGRRKHVKK
ncbi:MAG: class I SAM-dependent methyltransferase [Candidatus Heimdallarchaeota archaeon]|nr:class I SAM-dependent methyltransferase [Candidatus Heimdallarchaeota archaeon]